MSAQLKQTLNPSFALLFAVGVERLYKVIDPVVEQKDPKLLLSTAIYLPLTMVVLTLVFGTLSSITNDDFIEYRNKKYQQDVSAKELIAWLSYGSIFCALVMFYVAVDLAYVSYWWLGYAALCLVNAVWNGFAVRFPYSLPHVAVNLGVGLFLVVLFLKYSSVFSNPRVFYFLLFLVWIGKGWQRRQEREHKYTKPKASAVSISRPDQVLTIAHRVNTLAEVIANSGKAIEVDVQITSDHTPVLFHDEFLPGDGNKKRVRDLSYGDLRKAQPPIPQLAEMLNESRARNIQVLLDIKDRDAIDDVKRVICETQTADMLRIASFDYRSLVRAKEICGGISTILTLGISREMYSLRGFIWSVFALASPLFGTRLTDASVILCPAWRLTSRLVTRSHSKGILVFAWGAKGPDSSAKVKAKGIDAEVADVPPAVISPGAVEAARKPSDADADGAKKGA